MQEQATEAAVAAVAHKVTQAGGAAAVIGWLTVNDIVAIGGLLVAVVGVMIQFYYKRKADRRDAELHAAQMAELRRDG